MNSIPRECCWWLLMSRYGGRSFQIAPVDECGVARRRLRARTILVGGLAIGVELGRDVGNFPTSFRAYITYAAD